MQQASGSQTASGTCLPPPCIIPDHMAWNGPGNRSRVEERQNGIRRAFDPFHDPQHGGKCAADDAVAGKGQLASSCIRTG
jgi:hypothetical protein